MRRPIESAFVSENRVPPQTPPGRQRMRDEPDGVSNCLSLTAESEYSRDRAVIGRCWDFSRGPSAGTTCLSLTPRAVSSEATETPSTNGTRPGSGVPTGDQS